MTGKEGLKSKQATWPGHVWLRDAQRPGYEPRARPKELSHLTVLRKKLLPARNDSDTVHAEGGGEPLLKRRTLKVSVCPFAPSQP